MAPEFSVKPGHPTSAKHYRFHAPNATLTQVVAVAVPRRTENVFYTVRLFTGFDLTGALTDARVTISMDGRGRCMDNIFIERLWRSLKYEAVYLHELTDGFKAEQVIGEWIDFYNTVRPHSALAGRTPAEAYGVGRPVDMMDKPDGLPTSPPAQQQRQDVINRILAA